MIFVFGSNLAGIHGAGAALEAKHRGYPIHLGSGFHERSLCYGIPTKNEKLLPLSLFQIDLYVEQFIQFADMLNGLQFQVTQIGCGLAGWTPKQIAPMFDYAGPNCYFDKAWMPWFKKHHNYWGTK